MNNLMPGLNPTPSRATVDVGFKRWMGVITSSVRLVRQGAGANGVGCVGPSTMRLGGSGIPPISLIVHTGLDVGLNFVANSLA